MKATIVVGLLLVSGHASGQDVLAISAGTISRRIVASSHEPIRVKAYASPLVAVEAIIYPIDLDERALPTGPPLWVCPIPVFDAEDWKHLAYCPAVPPGDYRVTVYIVGAPNASESYRMTSVDEPRKKYLKLRNKAWRLAKRIIDLTHR